MFTTWEQMIKAPDGSSGFGACMLSFLSSEFPGWPILGSKEVCPVVSPA